MSQKYYIKSNNNDNNKHKTKTKRSNMDPNPQPLNLVSHTLKNHNLIHKQPQQNINKKINKNSYEPRILEQIKGPIHFSAHSKKNPLTKFKDHTITIIETNRKIHAYKQKQNKKKESCL